MKQPEYIISNYKEQNEKLRKEGFFDKIRNTKIEGSGKMPVQKALTR